MLTILHKSLRKYQKSIVDKTKNKKLIYLACKCGSGKTLMSLACIDTNFPVLIICPAFLSAVWENEIKKWFGEEATCNTIKKTKTNLSFDKLADFTIVSYTKCTNIYLYKQLYQANFKSVILDEAHFLKNPDSKRTIAILGDQFSTRLVTKKGLEKVILLSGTPMEKPYNLYSFGSTFKLLPPKYMDRIEYGLRYCKAYRNSISKQWVFKGCDNLDELCSHFEDTLFTVDPKIIEKELPPITHSLIKFDICQGLAQKELDLCPNNLEELKESIPMSAIALLRKMMLTEKIPFIIKYINNLIDNGSTKIIVFYHHVSVLEEVSNCKFEDGFSFFNLSGATPTNQRVKITEEFNSKEKAIIFCSISASNVGISLHTAQDIIFCEISWSWADNEQAFHRAWRHGADKKIHVHWTSIKNSVDDWMISTSLKKKKITDEFLKKIA